MTGMHHHHHHHDQAHGHDHHDHSHAVDVHAAIEDYDPATDSHLLERALRELLIEKGVIGAADIQRQIEYQESITPAKGARIIAKAWSDPEFRRALLADPKAAITSIDPEVNIAFALQVLENTPTVHYVVVCTLCSCYPRYLIGVPPAWYKSSEYRARVVREPRAVLKEFGLEFPPEVDVRVVDSTADERYLVMPMRPDGTEGYDEEALAALIGRDAMIGTALPRTVNA
jgi:nitrile hydratase